MSLISKVCRECGQTKPLSHFHKASVNKDGFNNRCKLCDKKYQQTYRKLNRQLVNTRTKQKRQDRKQYAIDYLGGCCYVCKNEFPLECYDLHHFNTDKKELTIGENWALSFDTIKKELDKCILVCSNCHRKLHSGRITLYNEI